MKAAVNQTTQRMEIQDPTIREAVQRRMEALTETHKAFDIKRTFEFWEEQNNRLYALLAAVRTCLERSEDNFNNVQLLNIGLDMLGCTSEINHLKKSLGVPV